VTYQGTENIDDLSRRPRRNDNFSKCIKKMKDGLLRCPKRKKCDVRRFALLNKGKRQLIIVKGEK